MNSQDCSTQQQDTDLDKIEPVSNGSRSRYLAVRKVLVVDEATSIERKLLHRGDRAQEEVDERNTVSIAAGDNLA